MTEFDKQIAASEHTDEAEKALVALCLKRALNMGDPQAGAFAIAFALLRLIPEVSDIGEQLYQVTSMAREEREA